MQPGYMWHWKQRQRRSDPCTTPHASAWCGAEPSGGTPEWTWSATSRGGDRVFGSSGFGIRRPVRFLGMRLELDEKQLSKLAKIVERIRIEREQAAVDLRRAAGEFADALEGDEFEPETVETAAQRRVEAARSVQDVVSAALGELHELLDEEQREELADLIRAGAVKL